MNEGMMWIADEDDPRYNADEYHKRYLEQIPVELELSYYHGNVIQMVGPADFYFDMSYKVNPTDNDRMVRFLTNGDYIVKAMIGSIGYINNIVVEPYNLDLVIDALISFKHMPSLAYRRKQRITTID